MNPQNTLLFLADWAIRGVVLATAAALLMKALRVNDSSVRLGAWVAVLFASLLIPAAMQVAPALIVMPLHLDSAARIDVRSFTTMTAPASGTAPRRIDWATAALSAYSAVAIMLLLRLMLGLVLSRRLIRQSVSTEHTNVRESALVSVPVTIGVCRPRVLLPSDWRSWDADQLRTVLEHERSHIRRGDPLIQMLSAIHRSLLWFSPLAWWLQSHIADLAEDASDDRALSISTDAETYAETLLAFVRRTQRVHWFGVAMARTNGTERRIDRILSGHIPSRGLGKQAGLAILLMAVFLTGVTAAMQVAPAAPAPQRPSAPRSPVAPTAPEPPEPGTDGKGSVSISAGSDGKTSIRFNRDEKHYVITDRDIVERFQKLFAPQSELGEKQSELGAKQSELGERQSELGKQMGALRTEWPNLTRQISEIDAQLRKQKFPASEDLERLQSQLAEVQEQLSSKQSKIGEQQGAIGELMAELGRRQAAFGDQQAALGRQQERMAQQASQALEQLIDSAIRRGLAKPVL